MADFELIGRSVQWEGRVIRAGLERYRYTDGAEVSRDKVWHPGAVGILAVDDTHVWLCRQPREAANLAASLEIPAGKRDVPGEPPLETAKRELVEEVGKDAAVWRELFTFCSSPGFSDERIWLYLATDLSDAPGGADARRGRAPGDRALAARPPAGGDCRVGRCKVADRAALARARSLVRLHGVS